MSYRQFFENLNRTIPFTEAWVVSTMPRGELQIVQPSNISEVWTKAYSRGFHAHDAITWKAIQSGHAICGEDCWSGGMGDSAYGRNFLSHGGLVRAIAAPVKAVSFDGYPGALHIYRDASHGVFQDSEVRQLEIAVNELDRLAIEGRESRRLPECVEQHSWVQRPGSRLYILDGKLNPILNNIKPKLDDQAFDQIHHDARQRLVQVPEKTSQPEFVAFASSGGELWNFNVIVYSQYPGLGTGPFVFYCIEPEYCEWNTLAATDFADAEIGRMIPAMQFMQSEFRRGPSLNEIAKTARLSPFHFHRRFTELLGITPKRFLLSCQIFQAKRMLASQEQDLVEIAKVCGFAHQSHFTSRFKQATGLTPTRWRKLAGKK